MPADHEMLLRAALVNRLPEIECGFTESETPIAVSETKFFVESRDVDRLDFNEGVPFVSAIVDAASLGLVESMVTRVSLLSVWTNWVFPLQSLAEDELPATSSAS